MTPFSFHQLAQRVSLGAGDAGPRLERELEERGSPAVLLIGTERAVSPFMHHVTAVATITSMRRHVPLEDALEARAIAQSSGAEVVVSVGGGSATGLAKAVTLTEGLPIIAIPTTYAGSEATPMWGITEGGRKNTGIDPRVLPSTVIYDTKLLSELPRALSVSSALNALAHGVDALWAPAASPITEALAEAGIRWITDALRIPFGGDERDARAASLVIGTYLTSSAFAATGSGMHHKICHVLGGAYDLPHAELHAVMLPHVLAYNLSADPAARSALQRAFGAKDVTGSLEEIYWANGAPRSLADLGFDLRDLDDAAAQCAAAIPSSNPRPVSVAQIRELILAAYKGNPTFNWSHP